MAAKKLSSLLKAKSLATNRQRTSGAFSSPLLTSTQRVWSGRFPFRRRASSAPGDGLYTVADDDDVRWTHYDRYVPKPVGGFDALIDHCAGDDAAGSLGNDIRRFSAIDGVVASGAAGGVASSCSIGMPIFCMAARASSSRLG